MIKYYQNILTKKQCDHIANGMLSKHKVNATNKDTTIYSNGAYGFYDLPEAMYFVPRLHNFIKRDYGNVVFKNNFTRIYSKGNQLKIHTDRAGLDITLSLCVLFEPSREWPIYVSNVAIEGLWRENLPIESYIKDSAPYVTPVGSGVACLGTKNPHWRDPLECDDGQLVIQAFYHWAFS